MDKNLQPIIIIGMHRSGTTMIASMLRELGLFIGNDLEDNSESMFFINHNDWLLHQCGGKWDNPSAIKWLYENPAILNLSDDYIRARIDGLAVSEYLGWKRFMAGERPLNAMKGKAWGWKDPRTTYTLPFWLRLFPEARIIHIYRNGIPVAASLRAREKKLLKVAEARHLTRKKIGIYNFVAKKSTFTWSNRCMNLEGGFTLWEEYVGTALRLMEQNVHNGLTMKYEDFLQNPAVKLNELAVFCGLNVTKDEVAEVASRVKPERANAHETNDELKIFSETVKQNSLMRTLGYE